MACSGGRKQFFGNNEPTPTELVLKSPAKFKKVKKKKKHAPMKVFFAALQMRRLFLRPDPQTDVCLLVDLVFVKSVINNSAINK